MFVLYLLAMYDSVVMKRFFRGWKLRMSTLPAIQNPGRRSLLSYMRRIIRCGGCANCFSEVWSVIFYCMDYECVFFFRWGRLRASMMPWPGLLEPFTECLTLSIVSSLSFYQLLDCNPLWPFCGHILLWLFLDICLLIQIQVSYFCCQFIVGCPPYRSLYMCTNFTNKPPRI